MLFCQMGGARYSTKRAFALYDRGVHGSVRFGLKLKLHQTARCKKKSHTKLNQITYLCQTKLKLNHLCINKTESKSNRLCINI